MKQSVWDKVARTAFTQTLKKAHKVKRFSRQALRWKLTCFTRDNHQCVLCGSEKNLQVHHIQRWVDNPFLRFKVENGATLCRACHKKWHQFKGREFPVAITYFLMEMVVKPLECRTFFQDNYAYHQFTKPIPVQTITKKNFLLKRPRLDAEIELESFFTYHFG